MDDREQKDLRAGKLSVLVVDADPNFRSCLEIFLKNREHDVCTAHDLSSAMLLVEKHDFDLILCEVELQPFSGIALLKAFRSRESLTHIVMMSGYPSTRTANECLNQGAYDFFFKPFRMVVLDHLLEEVQKRLSRWKQAGLIYAENRGESK